MITETAFFSRSEVLDVDVDFYAEVRRPRRTYGKPAKGKHQKWFAVGAIAVACLGGMNVMLPADSAISVTRPIAHYSEEPVPPDKGQFGLLHPDVARRGRTLGVFARVVPESDAEKAFDLDYDF